MISRGRFIKQALAFSAGAITFGSFQSAISSFYSIAGALTILYTNDTHARLDPFPANSLEHAGLGGIARRANLVRQIRKSQKHVLLLDAGDVFHGTPWFDVYGGEVDLELMSEMGYDAMAVGNHEFDHGLNAFAEAADKSTFPILAANYGTRNTPLNDIIRRFIVKEVAGLKVGIFGLGIRLNGVVDAKLYGSVQSRDPEIWASGMVKSLRQYHNCDLIICLSHLGYSYNDRRMDDLTIARKIAGIDIIIGGHTHTFLDSPKRVINPEGKTTFVTQMGHSGIRLGRIDITPESYLKNQPEGIRSEYYTIGKA